MTEKTTIVWREYYNEASIKKLEEMGTLPRNETDIDTRLMDGEEVAAAIAEAENKRDFECFREGGDIVILEPEEFAGTYEVQVEYEPYFSAYERAD